MENEQESMTYHEIEADLNLRIMKTTMAIKEQHPELSKYIEEMPVTIPDKKRPEVTLNNLRAYYESLNSMLNKYLLEHPEAASKEKTSSGDM